MSRRRTNLPHKGREALVSVVRQGFDSFAKEKYDYNALIEAAKLISVPLAGEVRPESTSSSTPRGIVEYSLYTRAKTLEGGKIEIAPNIQGIGSSVLRNVVRMTL